MQVIGGLTAEENKADIGIRCNMLCVVFGLLSVASLTIQTFCSDVSGVKSDRLLGSLGGHSEESS